MHRFGLNSVLVLRKEHPCGSKEWIVIRNGADIKIKCLGCDRIVMIDRPTLQRRIKKVINPVD
jgi:hypothetical protein